ncbi:hypothetical protein DIURU_005526 [Diutina rugosa]|uniref:Peptidase S54 rhomboid domain-containing protein n=1 Tax=Diutina rugosa TaxID=5481 RepID=A0A642UDB1_DIURU|nr:uncharacterized protein DIURU_005526 [Diutina rugosa]KAA8897013.1 hypothetical protein DIURU_005526 [Diutina rugosa]
MAQITPIKGFTNTPVTRSICLVSTVTAIALSVLGIKHYVHLEMDPHIIEYSQYWRIATYQLSVVNESDYLLTTYLWFYFKVLERFFGSRKYLSLVALLYGVNALAVFAVMALGQLGCYITSYLTSTIIFRGAGSDFLPTIFNEVTPGPLAILASLYVVFSYVIPKSYQFNIVLANPWRPNEVSKSVTLTNHFAIHIIFFMLVVNNGFKSIIPSVVGLLVGKLYVHHLLVGEKWMVPQWAFNLFVNPKKFMLQSSPSRDSYMPAPTSENPVNIPDPEHDTPEQVDEDGGSREPNVIRAETPARPLGSQLLDTFRN